MGQFVEYDTTIPMMGIQKYMHLKVRLDVTVSLKRKKKILIGKDSVVYTNFQFEKLSLFCFICRRLGHSESFCLIRNRTDPSKISFDWDISMRAALRRRNVSTSKRLREADGSINKQMEKESGSRGLEYEIGSDFRVKSYPSPNFMPLDVGKIP